MRRLCLNLKGHIILTIMKVKTTKHNVDDECNCKSDVLKSFEMEDFFIIYIK